MCHLYAQLQRQKYNPLEKLIKVLVSDGKGLKCWYQDLSFGKDPNRNR